MANPDRGEFSLTLNDKSYTLRPSFNAMSEFEDAAGCSVLEALSDAREGKIRAKTIAICVWAGMRGYILATNGNPDRDCLSVNEIGEHLQREHGFAGALEFAVEFLSKSLATDTAIEELEASEKK